jgi:hypothetical protein
VKIVKLLSIQIVERQHFTDHVSIQTDLPSATPGLSAQCLDFQFTVAQGNGKAYCEQHFPDLPIEIIKA